MVTESAYIRSKPKTSLLKKLRRTLVIMLVLTSVSTIAYSTYLFYKPNPKRDHLTLAQIEKLTNYSPTDSTLITSIKATALASHLATGDTSQIAKLKTTITDLNDLTSGKLPESKVSQTLNLLKSEYKLNDTQITELKRAYLMATLNNNINDLNRNLDMNTLKSLPNMSNTAQLIYTTAKDLTNQYLSSSNAPYPTDVDKAISVLNKFNDKLDRFITFRDLFTNAKTTPATSIQEFGELSNFERPFTTEFTTLSSYIALRDKVAQHNAELQNFKTTVDQANAIKNKSVDLDNWVGKTLKEAKSGIEKKGYKYILADGSDTDENTKIIDQYPMPENYALIVKGSTITLTTNPPVTKAPSSTSDKNDNKVVLAPSESQSSTTKPSSSESNTPKQSNDTSTTPSTKPSDSNPITIDR